MLTTEGDYDGLRMTNLKKLASFFKMPCPDVAPLKKIEIQWVGWFVLTYFSGK